MNTIQGIKQRFGIIGGSALLDRALETAMRVAPTDLSVLVTGESGTGKEVMPQIIHALSTRKHGQYIAVNCGAIPEGTIDSELFGHEKGAFTGAHDTRKGYFEVANGGTIFLDEVAELPLQTQVRLLRVLETGEFIKVGASKVQKTDVRIVAATNVDIPAAIEKDRFREDLFYRLSTVPIRVPALRDRKEDIHLLFRKFASDFAEKYRMPSVRLNEDASTLLSNYRWPGNIRQLKNIAEQISIIEQDRTITGETLRKYLPSANGEHLPVLMSEAKSQAENFSERELLYKVLFDMKKDVADLKKLVHGILQGEIDHEAINPRDLQRYEEIVEDSLTAQRLLPLSADTHHEGTGYVSEPNPSGQIHPHDEVVEESLSLVDKEIELIKKALEKNRGKRKRAAKELGISERTLYRKIKEYNLQ